MNFSPSYQFLTLLLLSIILITINLLLINSLTEVEYNFWTIELIWMI